MLKIQLIFLLIINAIFQIKSQLFQVTSLSSSISNNFTLVNGVTYDLNFSMTSASIMAGSTIGLKFSDRYYITTTNLLNCKATTNSATSPTIVPCNVTYYSGASVYQAIFTSIFSTTTTYSFLRITFQIPNPYGQVSQPINLTVYNTSNTMVGYGIAYISTYKASVMTGCNILSASMLTGANATHTYSFTPAQRLILNSYLLIQLPIWSGTTGNEVTNYPICTGLQGTDSTSLSCTIYAPVTTQTLNITTGLVSANRSASPIVLSIADLRNPWSVQPFGPITLSIMSGSYLTQVCYNVYNTVTNPNNLSVFTFSLSNLSIGATNTNVRLVFFPINPFPKPNNRVTLQFSSELTIAYTGSISVNSSNATQITLAGVTVYSISGFNVVNPPSSRSFTFKATTYVVDNGAPYAIQTKSFTTNCNVGSITAGSASPTNNQVNAITTYTVTFTITNRLNTNSFINVVFPPQLSIQTGSASCSMTGHACAIRSSSNISVTLASAVTAASTLTVTVVNVKNANQALNTSSFAIYSYWDSLYDSLVNQVTSGIVATMAPKILTPGTVTTSSLTTYASTFYRIDQTLLDSIPAGGFIVITFPNTTTPQSPQLVAASFGISSCSVNNPSTYVINITGCFTSAMSNLALSLNISNIRNPPSFKPSDSIYLYVRGPYGSLINYIQTGLTVTMNVAATTTSFAINPSSSIVSTSTLYSFQISHVISQHSINDYAVITIPSLMTLPTPLSCSAVSGITNISCIAVSNTQLKVVYLSAPSSVIQFNLSSVVNYLVADQSVSYSLQIFDSGNYKMEEYLSKLFTYSESTLTSVNPNNNSNIALGQLSNITLTISNAFTLYPSFNSSLTQLQITIPPEFTIGSTCTSTGGSCSKVSSSKYRVAGVGLSLSNLNVVMPNILLNYYNPTSTSFQVVYTYNGYNVSVKQTGIVLSIYCTSPCERCSTSVTTCQSCLPAPNLMIYHDSQTKTCLTACISGKYPDANNQCQFCIQPCATCLDSANCTSCVPDMWLYQTTCSAICPSTYYNSSNGRCLSCQPPCNDCNSLSSCRTCLTGYFSNNWCVNTSNCPNGTYANSSTMACESCSLPCANCLSATSCTTCQTGYLYYSNNCVPNCPSGMYQSSTNCFPCVGLCATCTSSTFCTSCTSNYLNQNTGTCVDVSSCPSGTYPNSTTLQCTTCPTGCASCLNSTNCTSCNTAIYVFYNYACYSSCPSSTYKSGVICLDCSPPCLTCRNTDTNCTSCISPKLFYINTCVDICPTGTYNNNGTCAACLSICLSCSTGSSCSACVSPLYLQNSLCVSVCSAGYYGNSATSSCTACSPPCSQCSLSPSNCTKCISPQLQYQNGCVNSCPAAYFNINGSCKTCPNCANCLDSSTCAQCSAGYYLLSGICYTTCPSTAPIPDDVTNTCGRCDSTCLTCYIIAKNCTSCYSNTFLYKGTCLTDCPLGFIQDLISGTCKQPLIGNVIYFPFTFLFLFFFLVAIASKCLFPQTQNITALGATISLCQFGSWCLLAYIVTVDYNLQATIITADKFVALACILLSIGMGASFVIAFYKQYEWDKGLIAWKEFQSSCVYSYRIVNIFSCLSFRFFRFLYGRFFTRTFLTMYIANGQRFLTTSNRLTFISLITTTLPMIVLSAFTLYKKQIYDQTFFCALDTVILGFIAAVILTIDGCKSKDHFQTIRDGLPFLKYKNMKNDESIAGESLLSYNGEERQKAKSQINIKERDELFKKITWLPNLNKFGHLNVLDVTDDKDEVKSLPEYNKLGEYPQFDPYRQQNGSDGDRVIDDLYFIQEQEEKKRKQEEQRRRLEQQKRREDEERRRLQQERRRLQQERRKKLQEEQQQQQRRRLKRLEQEQQRRKRQQEQRRKRQLMEQDERQRVQLQFPDLAAIDKVENKNGKRKNPLDLLSNCKKVDQKPIDDKALKKLQEIGKKNGIDPNFMKETFGVQKNHNPQLLNQIIDKHHHVKRESVKELFSNQNNPQILQQLFNKNSKMDPQKLREILNDPDSANLIKKMADKQQGILSPEMVKQLFDQNSKFTKQFTKNLLSDNNGMDPQKLKQLLKDSNGKGKDSPLKALMKIGGQKLENKQLLNNMMGEDAVLDPENFTKVANDLSMKAIQNIFKNKNKNSDIITDKILNNKKINLKNLAPILEDEQLLQELAQALGSGDENLQQNLLNLFKNAQNIDPVKLKQMLADPIIRQKLLSKPIDPTFLESLLDKNSKSDLKLLSQTLKNLPDKSIQQTFKFDPEKNLDFKNLAKLLDSNSKTDPNLVAKMLQPDMVNKLYVKGNDTKMLTKLVEKGNQFDPEVIKNVYGDQKMNIFDTKTDNMHKNMLNFEEEKGDQFRSQKQYSLGFQKNYKSQSQANMSRTAGGVLSFLTPIVPINNNKIKGKSKQFRENPDDGWTSQGQQEDEIDDEQIGEEQSQQNMIGKRKKKGKKTKKKLVDIRHPAEQIYLQRIEAPHEHAVRKASIRKKKKKVQNPGVMDQDNDIFDMDF